MGEQPESISQPHKQRGQKAAREQLEQPDGGWACCCPLSAAASRTILLRLPAPLDRVLKGDCRDVAHAQVDAGLRRDAQQVDDQAGVALVLQQEGGWRMRRRQRGERVPLGQGAACGRSVLRSSQRRLLGGEWLGQGNGWAQ